MCRRTNSKMGTNLEGNSDSARIATEADVLTALIEQ